MTVRMTIIIADERESSIVRKVHCTDKGRFMAWNKRENQKTEGGGE